MSKFKQKVVLTGYRYFEPDVRREETITFHRKTMMVGDMFKHLGCFWRVVELDPEIIVKPG